MDAVQSEKSSPAPPPTKRIVFHPLLLIPVLISYIAVVGLGMLVLVHYLHKPGPHIPMSEIPHNLPPAVIRAIEQLYSYSASNRAAACMYFLHEAKAGHVVTSAVPFIADLLDDEELYGRNLLNQYMPAESASQALHYMGEPGMIALLKASESKNTTVRYHSIFGLGLSWKDPRAVAALERLVSDKSKRIRRDAWSLVYEIRKSPNSRGSGQNNGTVGVTSVVVPAGSGPNKRQLPVTTTTGEVP